MGSITLEDGQQMQISPLALAMGMDPRKNETALNKFKQIFKKPEEEKEEEPKSIEEPRARTNSRNKRDPKPLEGMTKIGLSCEENMYLFHQLTQVSC